MELNLPPNADTESLKYYKEIIGNLRYGSKIVRGAIYNSYGIQIWEEPEEDYQARMNELFYEVK